MAVAACHSGCSAARRAQRLPQRALPSRGQRASGCRPNSPPSGLTSNSASVRSSCGSSSAAHSASRSCTAGCSVSTMRSSPATGTPSVLQLAHQRAVERAAAAHQHQDVAGAQLPPGAFQHHAPDPAGRVSRPRAGAPGPPARCGPGGCVPALSRAPARSVRGAARAATASPTGLARPAAWCCSSPATHGRGAAGRPANTASTAASTGAVERNDTSSTASRHVRRPHARPRCVAAARKIQAGSAPWKP